MNYLDQLFKLGSYKPENSEREYSISDFIEIAKGNIQYAIILNQRVEWQYPETLVEEDLREGEVIEIEGQYVMTNGNTIEINNHKDNSG